MSGLTRLRRSQIAQKTGTVTRIVYRIGDTMICTSPREVRGIYRMCGRCDMCWRLKSRDWVLRMMLEAKDCERTWLVTLTYRQGALPENGDGYAELQKWFKRLRKAGIPLRYVAVHETGTKGDRPHWHVLLFCRDRTVRRAIPRWPHGFMDFRLKSDIDNVRYVAKYIRKQKTSPRSSNGLGSDTERALKGSEMVLGALRMFPGSKIGIRDTGERYRIRLPFPMAKRMHSVASAPIPTKVCQECKQVCRGLICSSCFRSFRKIDAIQTALEKRGGKGGGSQRGNTSVVPFPAKQEMRSKATTRLPRRRNAEWKRQATKNQGEAERFPKAKKGVPDDVA